jgi:hypothetical protein
MAREFHLQPRLRVRCECPRLQLSRKGRLAPLRPCAPDAAWAVETVLRRRLWCWMVRTRHSILEYNFMSHVQMIALKALRPSPLNAGRIDKKTIVDD